MLLKTYSKTNTYFSFTTKYKRLNTYFLDVPTYKKIVIFITF